MSDLDNYFIYIIIPTYNREKLIKRALDSVISQSFKNWKIIVVDDGSTDDTKKVIQNYSEKNKEKIIYKYKNNGGSGSARNLGIETVLAENPSDKAIILFLDSDDALLPGALDFAVDKIKTNSEIKSFGFSYKDNFGKMTTFLLEKEMMLNFEQIITKKNVKNDTLNFFYACIFKDNSLRFSEKFNGAEYFLYWKIYKKYKSFFSSMILGIYYQDSDDSNKRARLTLAAVANHKVKNENIIAEFGNDLKTYNKKHLGTLYLVLARLNALLGNKYHSISYFFQGIKYNPLDLRRILLYFISLLDKKLIINNFLTMYFLNK